MGAEIYLIVIWLAGFGFCILMRFFFYLFLLISLNTAQMNLAYQGKVFLF